MAAVIHNSSNLPYWPVVVLTVGLLNTSGGFDDKLTIEHSTYIPHHAYYEYRSGHEQSCLDSQLVQVENNMIYQDPKSSGTL